MNESQKKYLTTKLVKLHCDMEEKLHDKNALVRSYNELVKKDKAYLTAYSRAVRDNSSDPLDGILSDTEMDFFMELK